MTPEMRTDPPDPPDDRRRDDRDDREIDRLERAFVALGYLQALALEVARDCDGDRERRDEVAVHVEAIHGVLVDGVDRVVDRLTT
jgi:hypothetical protein